LSLILRRGDNPKVAPVPSVWESDFFLRLESIAVRWSNCAHLVLLHYGVVIHELLLSHLREGIDALLPSLLSLAIVSYDISDGCLEDGYAITTSGKNEFFNIRVSELDLILSIEGVHDLLSERGLSV
jgi:hypothetical protein